MFADYQCLVLEEYHQKKADDELLPGLRLLRPAKLKEACKWVCNNKFQRKDEQVIRDFFEQSGDQKTCLQAIQRCGIDKFKPLINFLNGETGKTDEKNIELLAWLIDFNDRPFDSRKTYRSKLVGDAWVKTNVKIDDPVDVIPVPESSPLIEEKEGVAISPVNQGELDTTTGKKQSGKVFGKTTQDELVKSKWQTRSTAIAVILLSIIGAGGYWWLNNMGTIGNGGCMYWVGDHYEAVACSPRPDKALVVPLDSLMVKCFRKITVPDTITNRAKGRVWYSKINNKIEFYTSDGYHPIVTSHHLKPLSDHIIEKYIYPGMTSN